MPDTSSLDSFEAAALGRVNDQLLSALIYRAHEVAFLVDETGAVIFVPDVATPPLGYRPQESVGRSAFDFVHPDDHGKARALLEAVVATEVPQEPVELRALASDGDWRIVEIAATNLLRSPAVGAVLVNMRDVTDRVAMEEALRAGEARYRSIVETAQEGIWLLDSRGHTLFANQSLADILRRDPEEINHLTAFDVIDSSAHHLARQRLGLRRYAGHEVYELPFTRGDGAHRIASVSASPLFVDDAYVGSLAMISDVTERKRSEAELQRRALYDDVTGLPNRTLLQDRLDQAMRRRSSNASVAVFFVDVDNFKAVNDSYGHETGDAVLRHVAARLGTVVRDGDTLARFAGDEFVMVCLDVDDELEAGALAERLLEAVAQPVEVAGTPISVNASVGISLQQVPGDGAQLVRDADAAMLQAKKRGRGRHMMFDANVARDSRYHLEDVRELRDALDRGEVTVYFQPQIDMADGSVCSVEALARWRHPSRGLLLPSEFIALAEASGLIDRLGRHVLQVACAQAAQWARELRKPIPVAVNVSPRQLDDVHLTSTVRDALEEADLAPGLLGLEITETAVMSDPERALRVLTELHDDGVRVAIDDFGTGYSSLSHLKRLPVDEIKIDREFVDGVGRESDDRSIVNAVVSMAQALDLRVVGEGVETADQARALQSLGCDVVQGFLFGRPSTAQQITDLMTGDSRSLQDQMDVVTSETG